MCLGPQNVAKFEGHTGPITSLSFSENGYYLATSAADGVKLWDLRKLKNFRTLEGAVGEAAFDLSGLYLAAAGAEARIYGIKQEFAVIKELPDIPRKVRTPRPHPSFSPFFVDEMRVCFPRGRLGTWGCTFVGDVCNRFFLSSLGGREWERRDTWHVGYWLFSL